MLWSCLEIVVVEGGSPAVGDPLATNPLAWEENRHSSHYCSPWVITCVQELLWNLFCCLFLECIAFPRAAFKQTSWSVGLLARKYSSLPEPALTFCENMVILGQLVVQIILQLMWNTTNRGTDRRFSTFVL